MNKNELKTSQINEIVVVDHSAESLKVFSELLSHEGYAVRAFDRSRPALQSILEKQPSLVVLDAGMPEIDGFEVCRQLKAAESTRDIPVIFSSETTEKQPMLTGFRVGGADFLSKPFLKEEVLARVKTHINLFRLQNEMKDRNHVPEEAVLAWEQPGPELEIQTVDSFQPVENDIRIEFEELFGLGEIQKLQDRFALAFGVASVITKPDGTPITRPSNFTRLCQDIIRCTELGLKNCMFSDSVIGRHNPEGPLVQPCLSGGLWDAGASITVKGKHVASWLIGQVRNEVQQEANMEEYARKIGASETDFMLAFAEIPSMSHDQFQKTADMLFTMAGQLSNIAYQNMLQARFIRERKLAEDALRESEERFRTTLYGIGDGVITTDTEGKVMLMNPVAEQLTGWSQPEAEGKTLEEVFTIINENTRKQVEIPVRRVLREGHVVGLANHTLLIAKDGTERPIADSGAPIRNQQGEIVGVVLVFRDQTEERRAENALKESEFFFRESQRAASVGSYKYDLVTGFWDSSEVLDQIFGIGKEHVRDVQGWEDLIHPDDRKMMDRHLKKEVIGKREPFNKEYRIVRKSDGEIRWLNGLGQLNLDSEGNFISLIGTIQDITERKLTDEVLRESEERFRTTLYGIGDGVITTDTEGKVMLMNPVAEQLTGWSQPEAEGKTLEEVFTIINENTRKQVEIPVRRVLREGHVVGLANHTLLIAKDGTERPIADSGAPIRNQQGEIVGVVLVFRDQTEEREAENALRESEERYTAFVNADIDMVFVKDDQFRYVMANDSMARFFGKSKEELLNKTDGELADVNTVYPCQSSDRKALEAKAPFTIEEQLGDRIYETTKFPLLLKGNRQGIGGIMHDITHRKKADEKIRQQNTRLNAIIEAMPDLIFISDHKGNYIEFFNPKSKGLLYPEENLIGSNVRDVFDAPTAKLHIRKINECLKHKKLTSYEYSGENNGVTTFYEARIVYLEEDRVLRFVRDITDRKKDLETIQQEKQLLRTLIDNLPATIYVKDIEGRKIIANRADLEIVGRETEAEVLGKTDIETFNDEIGHRGYADDMKVIKTGRAVINREEVFQDQVGAQRWLLTSKIPLLDPVGKVTGLVGIGRDITEQKKSTETIHKLSKGIEQNPSSIVITDINGAIEYVNPKFTEITGYSADEAIGQNPRIVKSGNTPDEVYQQMWKVLISGEVWRGEFQNRKKNGELYWEWAIITSIRNEQGTITNYIALKEDISLRKQMEAELIVAKEKAEESDRLKSAFLANMSHEIRTPLNGIIGFSELLIDSDFEFDQKQEFIGHIISNGNNLLTIISDILDISKIESGEISIRKSQIKVRKFLDETRALNIRKVEEKQLRFNLVCLIPETVPDVFVLADKDRLLQIFNNLISNALKFTSEGYIQLGCRLIGSDVEFHVKDSGIGIPPEFHDKVFDRFRQVETSHTRKFGGNGLGLAITKNLVELMGGKIWIESEPGKGSTFFFTLPRHE